MKKLTFVTTIMLAVFATVFAMTVFDANEVQAKKTASDIEIIYEYVEVYHCIEVGDCAATKCDPGEMSILSKCYGGYWLAYVYEDGKLVNVVLTSRTPFVGKYCECIPDVEPHEDPTPQF